MAWFPAGCLSGILIGILVYFFACPISSYDLAIIYTITIKNSTDRAMIGRIIQLEPDIIMPINEGQDFEMIPLPPRSTTEAKLACENKFGKYSFLLVCFASAPGKPQNWDDRPPVCMWRYVDFDPSHQDTTTMVLDEADFIDRPKK